jgi:hypothetical protein
VQKDLPAAQPSETSVCRTEAASNNRFLKAPAGPRLAAHAPV